MIHAEFLMVEFRCHIMSSAHDSRSGTCSCNKYIILFTFFSKILCNNCNSPSHCTQRSLPPKRIIYTTLWNRRDSEFLFIFTWPNLTKSKEISYVYKVFAPHLIPINITIQCQNCFKVGPSHSSHTSVYTHKALSITFISSCTKGAGIFLFPSRLHRGSLCFLIIHLRRWKVERNILFFGLLQYFFFIKKIKSAFVFRLPVGKGNLKSWVLKHEQIAS